VPLFRALPLVLAALLAGGCAAKPEFIKKPYGPPSRVAVLPFDNMSNSVEAPVFMQKLVHDALVSGGYAVISMDETAAKLKEAGITQGGQEKSKTPQELARILGASAVLYGTVKSFSYLTLGVYMKREVGVTAELVGVDGEKQWKHTAVAKREEFSLKASETLGNMAKAVGTQLVIKLLEKLISHPLYPEMQRCVHDLTMTLPSVRNPKKPVGKYTSRGYDDFWKDMGEMFM